MLLWWRPFSLRFENVERTTQSKATFLRFDDIVQPPVASSDVRVAELGLVLVNQSLTNAFFFLIGNGANFSSVDDVHRTFGPHDGEFGRGPGHVVVALQVLAGHSRWRRRRPCE